MRTKNKSAGISNLRKFTTLVATGLLWSGICLAQTEEKGQSGSATNPAAGKQDKGNPDKPAAADKPAAQDKNSGKPSDPTVTRLKIRVTANDKPVDNATVYVRFNMPGGLLHRDKLAELDFKTNEDGSVKVPDVPRGRILIQVVAKGWHTYGKWYDVDTDQLSIDIKLVPPPKWY